MSILRYLECSSAHISLEASIALENAAQTRVPDGWPPMTIGLYEFGYFISVPEYISLAMARTQALVGGTFPESLAAVLDFAIKKECSLLRLDSDAEVYEELPLYEW